ncbi:alpha-amylase [Rhizoctonia solani AG-1 IA]|uniref:Alpha-amylase n=1 Tax=Thanatephorus cucumeris (strain AG1-IA) TaxID=983506 RepID=L8WXE8_THACA|nr:alpha-amylase [Rhizoctonia solani AG-1 IA]
MATHANIEYSTKRPKEQDLNYTMVQAFEWYSPGGGVHWNTLKDRVQELSDMGVTAMWLPPPTKASSQNSVGYDIYDILIRYGTSANLTKRAENEPIMAPRKSSWILCDMHMRMVGIVGYVDAVLNHKFGADRTERFRATEVDPNDRTRDITDKYDIEGWTAFDFPGRNGKYSQLKWTFNHFTVRMGPIFRIDGDGKNWAQGVDHENRNYDYLMGADIDHRHPEAHDDLLAWGKWVIDEIGAAGFRFDAIKHIDDVFIAEFVKHVRAETHKSSMFAVGEFWKDSLEDINNYLNKLGTQFSVFDAPLHYNFKEASEAGNNFDLREIFSGTLVKSRPMDAVSSPRVLGISVVQTACVRAHLAPRRWLPVDLYGCGGDNPQPPVNQLADIIRARKLFSYGETWVRAGDEHHDGCAVVICNGDEGAKFLDVGKDHAGEKWTDLLNWHDGEVTIGEEGWAEFRCPARSISIWTKSDARGREEFKKD